MTGRAKVFFISLGFLTVSFQTILLREFIAGYSVNELVIGYLLFVWLIGAAIGSLSGLKSYSQRLLSIAFVSLPFLCLIGILLMQSTPQVLGFHPAETRPFLIKLLICFISILPCSFVGGFLFSAGYLYFKQKITIEGAYLFEIVGFGIGGLLCGLIIFKFLSGLVLLSLCCVISIITGIFCRMSLKPFKVALLALLALLLLPPFTENILSKFKWTPLNVIEEHNTPYGLLSLIQNDDQSDIYFNSLRIETFPDHASKEVMVHLPVIQLTECNSALVIGGNPYTMADELTKYQFGSIKSITLDNTLLNIYERFTNMENNNDIMEIIIDDGRSYLANNTSTYDLILLSDGLIQSSMNGRYGTFEFFKIAREHLSSDGILSFSITSNDNYVSTSQAMFINSILNSLNNAFKQNVVIAENNITFISSNRDIQFDLRPEFYKNRLDSLNIENIYFNRGYLRDILSPFRQSELQSRLEDYNNPEISNSDLLPVGYFYSMLSADEFAIHKWISNLLQLPDYRLSVSIASLLIIMLLIIFPLLLFYGDSISYRLSLVTIVISGFSVMLLELIAIYIFQNSYGSIYVNIALLITGFMFSGAFGIIGAKILLGKYQKLNPIFVTQSATLILFTAILIPFIILSLPSGKYSIVLIIITGFAGGLSFVGVSRTITRLKSKNNPAVAYGYELFGAGIASLIGAPLLLPLIGVNYLFVIILIMNCIVWCLILLNR